MSWLTTHLKEFVEPVLGYIPDKSTAPFFTAEEMVMIKATWRQVKRRAGKRKVLLTGRDAWVFEVLARREDFPTLYLPHCSRTTVDAIRLPEPRPTYLMFDNGFRGTIPMKLGVTFVLMSHVDRDVRTQIFPRYKWHRELALRFDRMPKYYTCARMLAREMVNDSEVLEGKFLLPNGIYQAYSSGWEFVRAAQLTMEVYTDSTPRKDLAHERIHVTY